MLSAGGRLGRVALLDIGARLQQHQRGNDRGQQDERRGRDQDQLLLALGWRGDPGIDGLGSLRQGYLESSSVDAVREVTELIEAQRAYELNAKVITASDQMMSTTSQIR